MATQNAQTLKGFRDFISAEARKRQWLADNIRSVFETYGYEPLETPALEYESLLLGKYGKEADKLIYSFEDRGGRRVALRYDQTVPTARVVSQYRNEIVFPYKRYQIQPVWRADKPQQGRFREFMQCDADIIGSNSPIADAEILAVYVAIYKKIGLDSIRIKINDRRQLFQNIQNCGINQEMFFQVIQTLDKLDKKPAEEVVAELETKGISKMQTEDLIKKLQACQLPKELIAIIDLAEKLGVQRSIFEYDPLLSRGLDYYTGMIFEGIIPGYEAGSVGGGGRYDNLLNDLVGVSLPAVGFGLGFDRTLEAAEKLGKVPDLKSVSQVLVTLFSPEILNNSLETTGELRSQGITAEIFPENDKGLDKQLKYANKKGIPFVIIIGPEEAQKNVVKVKNMKTGEQKTADLKQIVNELTVK